MPNPSPLETLHDLTAETLLPRTRSVLIVEEDLALAQFIRQFLESHSFDVVCVPDGVRGFRQVIQRDFDVILCDLSLPNMPGFYSAVERRSHLSDRFILMTGDAQDLTRSGFLSKVSSPLLEKPFALGDLLSTIETLLTAVELKMT